LVGIEEGKEDVFLNGAAAIAGRCSFPEQNGTNPAPPAILGVLAARHFARAASATTEIPTPVGPLALAALGSRISVRGTEFEVQGIIEPETNQLLRSAVLVPLEHAQCVLQTPNSVTALLVSPKRASDIDPLQQTIESEHEELM
ncbi:MAG: ABC transporter permease, partial [Chloroflexi bacterium]|nr:ABC transporter permease [Chloroflexota bacterium]